MMSLANFKTMDPFILLSAVNMQLRDEYSSLDELCATNDIDKNELTEKLKTAGFEYNSEQNQVRWDLKYFFILQLNRCSQFYNDKLR